MAAPRGGELGPLSIGHAGAWRVVAMGVRDEHAFVYFDGNMLHMQSISGGAPAIVNGQPLPLEWTPIPEGSEIRLGEAVLWFGEQDAQGGEARRPSERPFAPGAFINEDSVVPGMVVRAIPAPPPPSARVPPPPPPPGLAPEPAFFPPAPPAPPAPTADPEVTRLAPIEEITGKAGKHPRPAAGRPMTAPTGTIQMAAITPFGGVPAAMPMPPAATPMGGVPAPVPSNPPQPAPYAPPSNPPMPMGPPYGAPAPFTGGSAMGPPSVAPIAPPKPDPLAQLKAYWKDAPPPRKAILVLSPFVLVSVFVLFFYEPAPPPAPPRNPTTTAAPTARPSAPPTGDPLPPPTETGAIVAPPPVSAVPVEPSATPSGKPAPSGSASAPKKTLQRAAADAVAAGAFLEAAALYEQLAREHPENPAYAEAARIMRAKAAGKR